MRVGNNGPWLDVLRRFHPAWSSTARASPELRIARSSRRAAHIAIMASPTTSEMVPPCLRTGSRSARSRRSCRPRVRQGPCPRTGWCTARRPNTGRCRTHSRRRAVDGSPRDQPLDHGIGQVVAEDLAQTDAIASGRTVMQGGCNEQGQRGLTSRGVTRGSQRYTSVNRRSAA